MSQFKVEINTDGAAFGGDDPTEAVRLLTEVQEALADGRTSGPLVDIYGTQVGWWTWDR